jgi:hypothetical protein
MSERTRQRVREVVYWKARVFGIPPVFITAHVHYYRAHQARVAVWKHLIVRMRIPRTHVAEMFGRSHRRLRKSVLGF